MAKEARPNSLENINDAAVTWRHIAPVGVTLADVQEPTYWVHVVRELAQQRVVGRKSFNRIEVLADDGSWEAELRVMNVVDEGTVRRVETRLLRQWPVAGVAVQKLTTPPGYKVEHVANRGWRVIDEAGATIKSNLPTEEDAIRFAQGHAKKAA